MPARLVAGNAPGDRYTPRDLPHDAGRDRAEPCLPAYGQSESTPPAERVSDRRHTAAWGVSCSSRVVYHEIPRASTVRPDTLNKKGTAAGDFAQLPPSRTVHRESVRPIPVFHYTDKWPPRIILLRIPAAQWHQFHAFVTRCEYRYANRSSGRRGGHSGLPSQWPVIAGYRVR